MEKHNNSAKKSEPTTRQAQTRGPVSRDTKEVLAELVGKLKEKLDPKVVAASAGKEFLCHTAPYWHIVLKQAKRNPVLAA